MGKFALLFAGCINKKGWQQRYNNDLGFMYEVLNQAGYDVNILYYDGRDINYNNKNINSNIASKKNFLLFLEQYKSRLTAQDQLMIFISNHGSDPNDYDTQEILNVPKGEASINCFGLEAISEAEFEAGVSEIKALKFIVLGQCYGGDFLKLNINNSLLMSANESGKVSFGTLDNLYDEFLYHFTAYLNNGYPNGDPLNGKKGRDNSIYDAFDYAKKNNYYYMNPGAKFYIDNNGDRQPAIEIPQIKENLEDRKTCLL